MAVMLDDIRFCRQAGANGVVVGALDSGGQLDLDALRAFRSAAGEMELVCHRAFDFTPDPFAALEQLIELGFSRILSSGQADNAFLGRFTLGKLVRAAAGRISIMPGSGIDASNIAEIVRETGASEFHFTGKRKVSPPGQPIAGLDAAYWVSDPEVIKNTINAATG
jgi:copper homeostasis protein